MASPWKQNFSFFASELTAQTIAHQYGQLPWRTEVDARTEMRLKAIKAHQGARCVPKKKEQQLQVIIFEKLLTKRQTDEPDWRMVKVHFDELSTTVVCGFRHTWKFCNANQISRKIWTRWLGKKRIVRGIFAGISITRIRLSCWKSIRITTRLLYSVIISIQFNQSSSHCKSFKASVIKDLSNRSSGPTEQPSKPKINQNASRTRSSDHSCLGIVAATAHLWRRKRRY